MGWMLLSKCWGAVFECAGGAGHLAWKTKNRAARARFQSGVRKHRGGLCRRSMGRGGCCCHGTGRWHLNAQVGWGIWRAKPKTEAPRLGFGLGCANLDGTCGGDPWGGDCMVIEVVGCMRTRRDT